MLGTTQQQTVFEDPQPLCFVVLDLLSINTSMIGTLLYKHLPKLPVSIDPHTFLGLRPGLY